MDVTREDVFLATEKIADDPRIVAADVLEKHRALCLLEQHAGHFEVGIHFVRDFEQQV